ncbi:transketolase C-terminal domain-containing protein, partial [Staphylococcus aureus]|nr:transketolase C-terminal domain-containing protein [Staphylococcus aureus]
FSKIEVGKAIRLREGSEIAVLSTGTIGNNIIKALDKISGSEQFSHYHFGFIKPLDVEALHEIMKSHSSIITIEDGVITGGFGCA